MSNEILICSVGDIMLCDSPLYASVGVGSKYNNNFSTLFENCVDEISKADIVLGNFETTIYEPKNKSVKELQMSCSGQAVHELRRCGFSILNVANNHCMQHGVEAFQNTVNTCMKNDIQPIGTYNEEPYIIEVKGQKLAFVSLCIHLEWYEPDNILYENRIAQILENIQKLRSDKELVIIVSLHWGDEYATYPSNAQVQLAHRMVDVGANIILGHHPHVCQGIEEYKDAVIVYSQGNFISDMVADICRETGIFQFAISNGKCSTYQIIPFFIDDNFVPKKSNSEWLQLRQRELKDVLVGNVTDDDYWEMIKKNHSIGHKAFVSFFKKNFCRYNFRISTKMLLEFMVRKLKRIVGTTTDGRVSSMDEIIRSNLNS